MSSWRPDSFSFAPTFLMLETDETLSWERKPAAGMCAGMAGWKGARQVIGESWREQAQ
jgi:hypothetical protein